MNREEHYRVANLLAASGHHRLARIYRASDEQRIRALCYLSGYSPEVFEAAMKKVGPKLTDSKGRR